MTLAAGPFATHTDPNPVSTSRGLASGSVATRVPTAPTSPAEELAVRLASGDEAGAFVPGARGDPVDAAGAAQALRASDATSAGNQASRPWVRWRTVRPSRPRMFDIAALAHPALRRPSGSIAVIKTAGFGSG